MTKLIVALSIFAKTPKNLCLQNPLNAAARLKRNRRFQIYDYHYLFFRIKLLANTRRSVSDAAFQLTPRTVKGQSNPYTRLKWLLGLQTVESPRVSMKSAHVEAKVASSKHRPHLPQEILPLLISVTG